MYKNSDAIYAFVWGVVGVVLVAVVMSISPLILRADDSTPTPTPGSGQGVQRTTDEIMKAQKEKDQQNQEQGTFTPREAIKPGRRSNGTPLPQNPDSPQTSSSGSEAPNAGLLQQFVVVLVIAVITMASLIFQHR
ncbi:MAG: hypothetical protein ABI947_14295 [Chloroflexota bacterium]